MRIPKIFLAGLCFLLHSLAIGQDHVITELPRWMVHASAGVVVPEGYMTRYIGDPSFAWHLEGLYRVKENQPVFIGLSTTRTTFQKKVIRYEDLIDGFTVRIREKTASRFSSAALNVRFQPEINWVLQPYVQGQVGWHYVYTNTKFWDRDENEQIDIINEKNAHSIGYGIQAGIQIVPNFWYARADIRVSYLRNPAVDFFALDRDSFNTVPIDQFEEQNAPFSLIFIHIGGSFLF